MYITKNTKIIMKLQFNIGKTVLKYRTTATSVRNKQKQKRFSKFKGDRRIQKISKTTIKKNPMTTSNPDKFRLEILTQKEQTKIDCVVLNGSKVVTRFI